MKKALILVCTVLLLLISHAAADTSYGDFTYTVKENEVYITSYTGNAEEVVIPASIEGLPVVSVKLSQDTIDETTHMGELVRKVTLPESIRTLEPYAFLRYTSLTEIVGLSNVQQVGTYAFVGTALETLVFSDALSYAGENALSFSGSRLVIPDDISYHSNCFELVSSRLEKIELLDGSGEATLALKDGVLFSADGAVLLHYPQLLGNVTYQIPEGTRQLNRYAFRGAIMHTLCDVYLPASLVTIDDLAFPSNTTFRMFVYENSAGHRYAQQLDYLNTDPNNCLVYYVMNADGSITENSIDEMLQDILDECITDGMTDYQKALALHDWLLGHAVYDDTFQQSDRLDILLHGTGVCAVYQETYRMLLDAAGIRNQNVGNYSHGYNALLINGHWIYVDCTWDDNNLSTLLQHLFFGMDNALLLAIYGNSTDTLSPSSAADHYLVRCGYADTALASMTALINQQIADGTQSATYMLDSSWYSSGLSVGTLLDTGELFMGYQMLGHVMASCLNDAEWTYQGEPVQVGISYDRSNNKFTVMLSVYTSYEGYSLAINDEGYVLTGYAGDEAEIVIPARIGGIPVVSIGLKCFAGNTAITSAVIPEGIRTIGNQAFEGCSRLRSITLPATLETIGYYAFGNCLALNDVTLPQGLKRIDEGAFVQCTSLTSIVIPGSAVLGNCAFASCARLAEVTICEGVTALSTGCLSDTPSLVTVHLPQSLTSIGASAFASSTSLASICIPDQVQTIGSYAFAATGLTSLALPAALENFDATSVMGCESLSSLTVSADNANYFDYHGMLCSANGTIVYVPVGLPAEKLVIGAPVKAINAYAFANALNLQELVIESSVETIGDYAFDAATELRTVALGSCVRHIGAYAFNNCVSLEQITLSEGLLTIGEGAFVRTFMMELVLPDSITSIGSSAFHQAQTRSLRIPRSMTTVPPQLRNYGTPFRYYIHENVTSIGDIQVNDLTDILVAGQGGTEAERFAEANGFAFWDQTQRLSYGFEKRSCVISVGETIALPFSIEGLYQPNRMFDLSYTSADAGIASVSSGDWRPGGWTEQITGCASGITTITVTGDENVRAEFIVIVLQEDGSCPPLGKRAVLPADLQVIEKDAFRGTDVCEVVVPQGCTSIGQTAFADCASLAVIHIPESVLDIADDAFANSTLACIICAEGSHAASFAEAHGIAHLTR